MDGLGKETVYAVDLNSAEEFPVGEGGGFSVVDCPSGKRYVVIREKRRQRRCSIYSIERLKSL